MTTKEDLEYLLKLLTLVKKQGGNEWFWDELKKQMPTAKENVINFNLEVALAVRENVDAIHKYLTLDVPPFIDYSAIEDEKIRDQLYRDCLEMGKYRLGKINGVINFEEFCRYAHLQAEELVNYFLLKKFSNNLTDILAFMKVANPRYQPKKQPENLNHIEYSSKMYAICNSSNIESNISYNLDFLKNIRNELSHRNSLQRNEEDEVMAEFVSKRFNKYVDLKSLTREEKSLFDKGKFITMKRFQDWNMVYETLEKLKNSILNQLNAVN